MDLPVSIQVAGTSFFTIGSIQQQEVEKVSQLDLPVTIQVAGTCFNAGAVVNGCRRIVVLCSRKGATHGFVFITKSVLVGVCAAISCTPNARIHVVTDAVVIGVLCTVATTNA